jgi:large subunit ribosomal protein L35
MPALHAAPRLRWFGVFTQKQRFVMPKMKTKRAAAKRIRVTGTGKLRRGTARLSHLMRGKPARRLRKLRKHDLVDPSDAKRFKRLLPYLV